MENTSIQTQAPNWNAFLNHIFNGNAEAISQCQFLMGQGLKKEALS